ncbi:hypothetical protein ACROYT_G006460 [Oculina patagonica]
MNWRKHKIHVVDSGRSVELVLSECRSLRCGMLSGCWTKAKSAIRVCEFGFQISIVQETTRHGACAGQAVGGLKCFVMQGLLICHQENDKSISYGLKDG